MAGYSSAGSMVGIAKESVWGTPVTATDLIPFEDASFDPVEPRIEDKSIRGDLRAMLWDTHQSIQSSEITITSPFWPEVCGHYLMAMFGTDTIAAGTTHTFSVSASNYALPSYTITDYNGAEGAGSCHSYSGQRIKTLKLTYTPETFLMAEASFVGKSFTVVAKPSLTAGTVAPLLGPQTFLTVGGGTVTCYEEWEFEFDRGTEPIFTLSGTGSTPIDPLDVRFDPPSGSFTGKALFDNMVEATRFYSHSKDAVVVTTRATSPKLAITATLNSWDACKPSRSADDLFRVEIEGQVMFSSTDAGICKPILTNQRATAY